MSTFVTNEFHAKPGRGSDVLPLLVDLSPESLAGQGVSTSHFVAIKTALTTSSG